MYLISYETGVSAGNKMYLICTGFYDDLGFIVSIYLGWRGAPKKKKKKKKQLVGIAFSFSVV